MNSGSGDLLINMCGRFALITPIKKIIERYLIIENAIDFLANYNISPTISIPVLILNDMSKRELKKIKWGIESNYNSKKKIIINIKDSSFSFKPFFFNMLKKSRCLFFADGFYEWKKIGNKKIPFYFFRKNSGLMLIAGVFNSLNDSLQSAIITTHANEKIKNIHDRMPVIISEKNIDNWLNDNTETQTLINLLKPISGEDMEMRQVSDFVNSVKNNSAQCIQYAEIAEDNLALPLNIYD